MTPPPAAPVSRLAAGDILAPDGIMLSPNGRYRCHNQPDGNLVLSVVDGAPYWATNTGTTADQAGNLNMQHDGNLVLYRADGTPAWNAYTSGVDASAALEDSGRLVVRVPTALWQSDPPTS
jgi:hypothetical protein